MAPLLSLQKSLSGPIRRLMALMNPILRVKGAMKTTQRVVKSLKRFGYGFLTVKFGKSSTPLPPCFTFTANRSVLRSTSSTSTTM